MSFKYADRARQLMSDGPKRGESPCFGNVCEAYALLSMNVDYVCVRVINVFARQQTNRQE